MPIKIAFTGAGRIDFPDKLPATLTGVIARGDDVQDPPPHPDPAVASSPTTPATTTPAPTGRYNWKQKCLQLCTEDYDHTESSASVAT